MPTDTNLRSGLIRLAASLSADKRAPLLQILACDHAATEAAGGECCGKCDIGSDKQAMFEEGVSADPTENMSPEDAAEWKKQNAIHKDKFKTADFAAQPGQKAELSDAMIQIVKHLRYCMSGKFGPVGQQALSDVMALVVELMSGSVLAPNDRDLIRDRALAHAHKFIAETKFILPSGTTGMKLPMSFTASKTYVLTTDLKLKSGDTITVGTKASVGFDKQKHSVALVQFDGRPKPTVLSIVVLHRYFAGMAKPPTVAALEKMDEQGHCKTVTGYKVEPDGTGPDGSPSWLLAMGMV